MRFINLDIPPAGTWLRDCILYAFSKDPILSLEFTKESDETKWRIFFDDFIAFKITSHEFAIHLILLKEMPNESAFFILDESPWLKDLKKLNRPHILDACKHYVLFFYDEVVEVISQKIQYEKILNMSE